MKKLLSLILILCMACTLIPAMADETVTGDWYLVEMIAGDAVINPAEMGINWILTLNEDGTMHSAMGMAGEEQEQDGTWAIDGETVTLSADGTDQTMVYADGRITMSAGGQTAVFGREAPVAAPKAAAVAAESEDAFLGSWELAAVELMGMTITKDTFAAAGIGEMNISLVIESGKVAMSTATSADPDAEPLELATVFEDGKLLLKALDTTMFTVQLMDDGSLTFVMSYAGMDMTCYLVPAAAAEEPAA